jgi:hypothetical protein
MGDSQNVIDVKVAGASVFTVDYFGNLNFASAITTIRNASTLRYGFFSAVRLHCLPIFDMHRMSPYHFHSIDAATIVMDANGDGQGLSLTYVDTANNIQFPNSSGTVVLDSGN